MAVTTELAREVMEQGPAVAQREHAALFERVMHRIHGYFRRVIWNQTDADDCLQRTLLLIEESLQSGTYDPDYSFNVWLWLKARTVYAQWCRGHAKRAQARAVLAEKGERSERGGSDGWDRTIDGRARLRELEAEVGEECFETMILYYLGGLTHSEIAKLFGCERRTIGYRVARCDALLKGYVAAAEGRDA